MNDNDTNNENHVEINFNEPLELDMESILREIDNTRATSKNPYTHEIDFSNVNSLPELIEVMKNLDISVDPNQWKGDVKFIKLKGE